MNKSVITLTTDQLALLKDDKIMLCEVLREQPPDGWTIGKEGVMTNSLGEDYCFFEDPSAEVGQVPKKNQVFYYSYHLQYKIGTVLVIEGIDTYVKVVDVKVKRVRDVTLTDIELLCNTHWYSKHEAEGMAKSDFKDWFNTKYAKPHKRVKNGKIIGYECWCCELNQAVLEKHKYIEFGFKHEEPLEIYPDPFVLLTTLEVKK